MHTAPSFYDAWQGKHVKSVKSVYLTLPGMLCKWGLSWEMMGMKYICAELVCFISRTSKQHLEFELFPSDLRVSLNTLQMKTQASAPQAVMEWLCLASPWLSPHLLSTSNVTLDKP